MSDSLNIKYYSRNNLPIRKPTSNGSGIRQLYTLKIDETTGRKELKPAGSEDLYAKIQESHEATKIENIIARYTAGDLNALSRYPTMYADIVGAPKNLMEAVQKIQDVQTAFEELPASVKAKFEQNPDVFIHQILTGEAIDKLKAEDVPLNVPASVESEGDSNNE